jgi:hypothetical protein
MPEKHPLQAKYPDLQKSTAVELSAEQRRAGGERIPNEPGPKLEAWMSELEGYLEQIKSSDESYEGFKNLAGKAYITGTDDASVKLKIDRDAQIAQNRGHGMAEDIKEIAIEAKTAQIAQNQGRGLAGDIRERAIETIIQETRETIQQDQESSLDDWIDYLASGDATYPMWFKYYVFRNITKLSSFDKEKGEFPKRSRSTTARFPDINREALAYMQDSLAKHYGFKNLDPNNPETEIDPQTRELLDKEANFASLYRRCIEYAAPKTSENLNVTDGEWVKFDQSDDPEKAKKLANSLHGHSTGWCTAGEGMAQTHLAGGDFYVYYTKGEDGQYSVPRVAIRMQSGSIEEVRGIEADQNLEGVFVPIAEAKMNEVDAAGAEAYKKKAVDMQRVTEIYARQQEGSKLTEEDLTFIYELNDPIEGFGYKKDPRIEQMKQGRDIKADLSSILGVPQELISLTKDEALSGGIVYHFGDLLYPNLAYADWLIDPSKRGWVVRRSDETLPQVVAGSLVLKGLTSAEGLVLPQSVGGDLVLSGLTKAEGLVLPQSVGGDLDLSSLTRAEGLILPTSIVGTLHLDELTSAEGLILPASVGGDLWLNGLTNAYRLTNAKDQTLPASVGGDLHLSGLTSAKGITLPKSVGGSIYCGDLTSAEDLTLPQSLGGDLILDGLTSAEGLTLPQSMSGDLHLNALTSAKGLTLPKKVDGNLFFHGLTSAEGLNLPQSVDGLISFLLLTDEDKQSLREQRPDLADKIE